MTISAVRRGLVATVAAVGLLGGLWVLIDSRTPAPSSRGGDASPRSSSTATAESTAWPHPQASLTPPSVEFPPDYQPKRIYLDPGHGAEGNTGNVSALCEDEQDFTLRTTLWLARWLEQTGHFEVKLSRRPGEVVEYQQRVNEANRWRTAAFLSIHSDVRGRARTDVTVDGRSCPRSEQGEGFSVLWSDDGPPQLGYIRLGLARALAKRLREAGFPAYDGAEYRDLYEPDPQHPGVFLDRHEPEQRIYVLRKTHMPAVIIETHNATHLAEARRWNEEATREAFAAAVAAALIDVLR